MTDKQKLLLREITRHGNVSRSCKKWGVARSTHQYWCLTNEDYREQVEIAKKEGRK